ncbi:hypothetical protein [Phaeobacter inhibens]|uniref:hypothetical protein n=1 Tax=Phaeobacter inhibens TaxID=221822 RepID=UPI00076BB85E|nr:hypothetical protein [Phaeobacter inhibens]KXF90692.1 hypothetical protein AT574_11130 [Phaeobacter inhibens]WHP69760.1 hypothetical protein QMZ01_06135 [Phaeobacter inhibens]
MEAIQRIIEVTQEIDTKGNFSRADFDELAMLVEHSASQLPKRFVKIVEESDRKFPSGPTREAYNGRIELAERLRKVLNVAKELPSSPQLELDDDALLPTFSLEKNDKSRVLELCAQMRKIVLGTEIFDQPHRRRLLNRIAGIEYQVEQPKGLLDVLRAGVSDVGETLGKFGTDIEPLTKRMNEVTQIARSNSKEYDKIPSPEEVKRLPAPENPTKE